MQLLKWNETDNSDLIAACCSVLEAGGILAYPTDTLYGLGVDATNAAAVAALNQLKGRQNSPISVLVDSPERMKTYLKDPSSKLLALIDKFLPGPVTIIAETEFPFAPQLMGYGNSVGFRVVDHEFCTGLFQKYQKPITTTSVNLSGRPPAITPEQILEYFPQQLDIVVAAGRFSASPGSTVINSMREPMEILREGVVALNELRDYLS